MTPEKALEYMTNLLRLMDVDDYDEELYPMLRGYILNAWGKPDEAYRWGLDRALHFLETGEWR